MSRRFKRIKWCRKHK